MSVIGACLLGMVQLVLHKDKRMSGNGEEKMQGQHRLQDFDANALPGADLTVLLSFDSFANGNTSTYPMQWLCSKVCSLWWP